MAPWQHRSWPVSLSDLLVVVMLLIAGTYAVAFVAGVLFSMGVPSVLVLLPLLAGQSLLLFFIVRAIVITGRGLTWAELGLGAFDKRSVPHAVLMGFLAVILSSIVFAFMQSGQEEQLQNPQQEMLRSVGSGFGGAFLMVLLLTTIVPFVEELAFRGLLYGWLRQRFEVWQSAAISSLFFAVMHDSLLLVPAITVVGLVLALLYERHKSIWPCIVAHGAFNAINLISFYLSPASGVS